MNEMQIFQNPEFGTVRTVELNGEPWLVGKDVAEALGYSNTRKALADHVEAEDKGVTKCDTLGGTQELTIINESGLYSLVLSSKLPTAKKFRKWVTGEVLPSIRKHGAYMTQETLQAALLSPDTMIALCQQLKDEQCKRQKLEAAHSELQVRAEIMRPKAEYFDQLVDRNLLTSLRDTSKVLGVGQQEFIAFLTKRGFLFRDKKGKLMPTASKNDGLFEVKECFNEKTAWSGVQTMVTPKGRETFRMLILG